MSGRCWTLWAGVASAPWARRVSGTRRRFGAGVASAGRPSKKSPSRRAYDRLHRRKRGEPAATPGADMVASRPNAGAAIQLQLGQAFRRRRDHVLQLLLPVVQGIDQERGGGGLPGCSAATHPRPTADRLGSVVGAQEPDHPAVHRRAGGAAVDGVPAGLCAGTEPGRVHLGLLEATRAAKCLPERLLVSGRDRPANAETDASPASSHPRLLATGRTAVLVSLYYEGLNKPARCQRADRGAWPVGAPHLHLALNAGLWPRGLSAPAGYRKAEVFYLAHG